MQQISQQELERRVKQLMARMGQNRQQRALTGRKGLNRINLEDIDTRQLGLGGGKYKPRQEAETFTQPEATEPETPELPESDKIGLDVPEGESAGFEPPDLGETSELGKTLGHGEMPDALKAMLAKGGLSTALQALFAKGLIQNPISLANAVLAISKGTWGGIKDVGELADVTSSLKQLGLDPNSPDALDAVTQAQDLNAADYDEAALEEDIDPTAVSHMTDQPTAVDAVSDVLSAHKNKSMLEHLQDWWNAGQGTGGSKRGAGALTSDMDVGGPGLGIVDVGGGPQSFEIQKETGPPAYEDKTMTEEDIEKFDREINRGKDRDTSAEQSALGMDASGVADFNATYGGYNPDGSWNFGAMDEGDTQSDPTGGGGDGK